MIHKLTDRIWFGDALAVRESIGQVGSVLNVAHSIRRRNPEYWQDVAKLSHAVLYFKLAKKDREEFDEKYIDALKSVVSIVRSTDCFPLLTHCQMGGHRGPTSAIFAAWWLDSGRSSRRLDALCERAYFLVPALAGAMTARGNRCLYHKQVIAWCRANAG